MIRLLPYTLARCTAVWESYVPDPAMSDTPWVYDPAWVRHYWETKVQSADRVYFAICEDERPVGEIQLKAINWQTGTADMSIIISRDEDKGRGIGTQAEKLLLRYAFGIIGLQCVQADTLLRNTRSAHVLAKLGFTVTHQDDTFVYFSIRADDCP